MNNQFDFAQYAAEHIVYEIDSFFLIGNLLLSQIQYPQPISNACIESFAVHLRVLYDFLFPLRPKEGDVTAKMYCKEWEQSLLPTSVLACSRELCNKQIAHLTTKRSCAPGKKEWPIRACMAEMYTLLIEFSRKCAISHPGLLAEIQRHEKYIDASRLIESSATTTSR